MGRKSGRRNGISLVLGLVAVFAFALGTLAIPIQSWRTGEVETERLRLNRSHAEVPSHLWIDTDAACGYGHRTDPDDCFAILRLARSGKVEIVGLSTVFGNAELAVTDRITRRLASQLIDQGVVLPEVVRGAAAPMAAGARARTDAGTALADALEKKKLTILALGPLTNIAMTLRAQPALRDKVERIVAVMGRRPGHLFHPSEGSGNGGFFGHGPVFSDFNFRKDPDAARYLLSTDIPLTLIPYEVARDVLLTSSEIERVASSGLVGAWIADGAEGWMEFWQEDIGLGGFYPFDLVAAHFVLAPSDFFCAKAEARIDLGWAPSWLWPIDSAGLLVTPLSVGRGTRAIAYCPHMVVEAKMLFDQTTSQPHP